MKEIHKFVNRTFVVPTKKLNPSYNINAHDNSVAHFSTIKSDLRLEKSIYCVQFLDRRLMS